MLDYFFTFRPLSCFLILVIYNMRVTDLIDMVCGLHIVIANRHYAARYSYNVDCRYYKNVIRYNTPGVDPSLTIKGGGEGLKLFNFF